MQRIKLIKNAVDENDVKKVWGKFNSEQTAKSISNDIIIITVGYLKLLIVLLMIGGHIIPFLKWLDFKGS